MALRSYEMTDPYFGVVLRREDNDPRPAIYADMSTIGLIGPAPDADVAAFPVNTPVGFNTDNYTMIAKLGASGFLQDAIRGINDQLATLQRAARVVIIRTAAGVNADATIANQLTVANIMGSSAAGTGMWAFMQAAELTGATPRLICAPGYTGLLANGVDTITVADAGSGYINGQRYDLTFTGGGTNAVLPTGYSEGQPDGTLGEPIITSPGAYLTTAPTIAAPAPGGAGTTATMTAVIGALANPIVASLPGLLDQLLAHAVVETAGTSFANDLAWREAHNSDRIIAVAGGVRVVDPATGNVVVRPFAPRFAAAIVARDHETGGPFRSAANQPIRGIVGPGRSIRFSIVAGENEGQQLLSANIGVLVKGDVAADFAIATGGFVAISTDNIGEDELWRHYNQTRGRDFIHLTLIRAWRYYLGRFNITVQTLEAVVNTLTNILRDLKADENILGYKVSFSGTQNSAEEIRKGHLTISFAAEEPSPLKLITGTSSRYRPAIDALVQQLEAQLNMAA
jgi:phage tail sheath protein FI